MNTEHYEV